MPLYDFKCPTCGKAFESNTSIAARDDPVSCECGADAKRCIATPHLRIDITTDAWVNRHKKRK